MDETTLKTLFPQASPEHIQAFAATADDAFTMSGITPDTDRQAYFLAQVGHESGGLTIVAENLSYSAHRLMQVWPSRFPDLAAAEPYAGQPEKLGNLVYANRMGNGDPASGDGFRYRGRGYIQLTGRDAYRTVGASIGVDLETDPDLAATPENALRVACGYWLWKALNPICDAGDFAQLTKRINGAFTGFPDRVRWLGNVYRIVMQRIYPTVAVDSDTVKAVQAALFAKGYGEVGTADGKYGPATHAGVLHFRYDEKLPPGPGIDAAFLEALRIPMA